MKKFLLSILTVLMLACACAAFACAPTSPDGTYYTLVFKKTNGVTYVCDIPSGYEVLEGTTVTFSLKLSDNAEGKPVVYVNDEELDEKDGKYSFIITQNTTVRVDGIMAQGSEYNKLIFASTPGVSYNILTQDNDGNKLRSGMLVKMGTEVKFGITVSNSYSGEAQVLANGQPMVPQNGVYTFNMEEPTTITVDGVYKNVDVTYVSGDTRVRYFDEQGERLPSDESYTTVAGDVLKFKVKISVYHIQTGYDVLANGTVLTPDDNGYYTFELTDDTNIAVTNLTEETSFVERANGGSGTERDPYRISRPIDLFQMAMLINDGWYTDGRFFAGYYRLENDIDFDGEQLYVIGDGNDSSNGYAIFSGTFDGNGHTISNYVMNDEWIDQEQFAETYLTKIGLFGIATSMATSSPSIFNLHIDNATLNVNAARYDSLTGNSSYEVDAGILIGQSFGAYVSGCTVTNSKINVRGSSVDTGIRAFTYAGGLIGAQLSAYSATAGIRYFSGVVSCSTDVDINSNGFVYGVGGITGMLAVGEESLTSYILNCSSSGDISGGFNAGGIVGYMGPSTSVSNSYSSGDVIASTPIDKDMGYPDEELLYANAGGIAGRAGFNSVIYRSFSAGGQYANPEEGAQYQNTDPFAAYKEDGDALQDAHAYKPTVFGCESVEMSAVNETFIRNTMKWDEQDWIIGANGTPVFNPENTSKNFSITFSAAGGFGNVPGQFDIDNQYSSLSRWIMSGGIAEYVDGNNGNRSYGYFFDEELEHRIPISFVPTGNMTIYIGFANYNDIAGTYYLGDSANVGARLEFEADGHVTYINGALSQNMLYTYDGANIVILNSALGELSDVLDTREVSAREKEYYLSSLYNFGATIDENGAIAITGGYIREVDIVMVEGTDMFGSPIQTESVVQTGNSFRFFENDAPLRGLKAIPDFKYIDYYNSGAVYAFNGNGTGTRTEEGVVTPFTYTYSEGSLTIKIGGDSIAATVENGYVTQIDNNEVNAYDGFTGAWEASFAQNVTYTFNGKSAAGEGSWTMTKLGVSESGSYTVEDGKLNADSFTAEIKDSMLVITRGGASETLYKGGSFAGEWYYSQRQGTSSSAVTINLKLNGIAANGLGTAVAEYATTGENVALTYRAVENNGSYTLSIYNQATCFAELTYNKATQLLEGTLNGSPARLTATDGVKGLWISDNDDLGEVQFNGRGYYNLPGDTSIGALAVNGTVYVKGSRAGNYTLSYDTMEGSFAYKGVTYTIKYDPETDTINASAGSESFVLRHRDIWYNRKLVDEKGFVYTFDGKGELASGGTVIATDGEDYRQYKYFVTDGKIELKADDGFSKNGEITPGVKDGKQVYLFTETDASTSTALTYSTPFTGEWIIGGVMGELTIDKIYADFTASGSYKFRDDEEETKVTFTYNEQGNYLSFVYEENTNYYVNALVSGDSVELSVGPENSATGSTNSICIKKGLKDDYYGKTYNIYNAQTKADSGDYLVFDGLGNSVFGSGTAVLYNNQNREIAGYRYSIDEFNKVRIVSGYTRYVMTEWEKDSEINYTALYYVHENEDYYAIIYPDSLYGSTVKDASSGGATYTFDGVGGVTKRNADGSTESYKYYVLLADNITYKHILRFTAEDGTIYSATLDQSSNVAADWTVKMTKADDYFALSVKEEGSETGTYLFDGAGRVIRLTTGTDESVVNYSYEWVSGERGGIITFTFTGADNKQYTAELNTTSQNQEEWTLKLTAKA